MRTPKEIRDSVEQVFKEQFGAVEIDTDSTSVLGRLIGAVAACEYKQQQQWADWLASKGYEVPKRPNPKRG